MKNNQIVKSHDRKCVCVLLATFNGLPWLPEQVDSILNQSGVDIRLVISDDVSSDGTWDWLLNLAITDPRVTVLSRGRKYGSAAANFYRLVVEANIAGCDYVAFADQDDIWESDKLVRHVGIAVQGHYDGVSSNVIAFWPNGYSVKVKKSQPQRELDYLFASPGPGCTFLMTPWLVGELRRLLVDSASCAKDVALHDWLVYAVCRASGRTWYIDDVSSVKYRQHHANEFGANHGLIAGVSRLRKLKTGWYRAEVLKVVDICMLLSRHPDYADISRLLRRSDIVSRIKLLRYINKARRRFIDRLVFALATVSYLF